ncbi:hypothetical protein C8R44DRAFT_228591 [Mycena epipterygia]|nr:hypothetical protein C8R44DRAFT_228591 [Mycena epipterygia]
MSLPQVGIAGFPQDVLLELAKQLDVADLISFLATCRVIREVQLERTLWIDALARIKTVQMQPLPLSSADELDTLPLQQLQDTVRWAARVIHNLRSDSPRPVLLRTFNMETTVGGIFPIPGTNIAVSCAFGSVSCWDIPTSLRVAHLEIPGLKLQPQTLCLEIKGKALIGAYISATGLAYIGKLAAICIDYRDRAHILISHVVSPDISCDAFYPGFFINSKVVGLCTESSIISWSMQADAVVHIDPEDIEHHFATSGIVCQPFQGRLYIFQEKITIGNAAVQSYSLLSNPRSGSRLTPDTTTLDIPDAVRISGGSSIFRPFVFSPDHGVFAVTCRIWQTASQNISRIHFWPAQVVQDKLRFGQPWLYEHPDPIYVLAVGTSGTYVLIVVREGGGYLGLLHFSAAPLPHATFRKLDVGDLSMDAHSRFALDETLGLVLIVNDEGIMTAISYA